MFVRVGRDLCGSALERLRACFEHSAEPGMPPTTSSPLCLVRPPLVESLGTGGPGPH
jgi:hypothetical protein